MYSAILKYERSVTGVLVNQNEEEIELRDAQGIVRSIDRTEVTSFSRLPISLMPPNLHQVMTIGELVDLVEYLTTLREASGPEGD